jgi:heterodisulfide reductase subunit C/quinone-modifying oxidoreductase subunit QmoC
MAIRVNPKLIDQLERYGADDVKNCYHCGNCSAVCPHTDETHLPATLHAPAADGLGASSRPHCSVACYYCGQCSEQCRGTPARER